MSFVDSPPAHISTLRTLYEAEGHSIVPRLSATTSTRITFDCPTPAKPSVVSSHGRTNGWANFEKNMEPAPSKSYHVGSLLDKTPLYEPEIRLSAEPKRTSKLAFPVDGLNHEERQRLFSQRYQKTLDLPEEEPREKSAGEVSHTDIFKPDENRDVKSIQALNNVGKPERERTYGQSRKNEGRFSSEMLDNSWDKPQNTLVGKQQKSSIAFQSHH